MTAEIVLTRKQNHGRLDTGVYQRGDVGGLQHDRVCEYMAERRGGRERAFD